MSSDLFYLDISKCVVLQQMVKNICHYFLTDQKIEQGTCHDKGSVLNLVIFSLPPSDFYILIILLCMGHCLGFSFTLINKHDAGINLSKRPKQRGK